MLLGACTAVVVLMPFLITDTDRVVSSFSELIMSKTKGGGVLTFWPYLFQHLPDLVGWTVLSIGFIEFVIRLIREPRGTVLLAAVPLLHMVFLGLHTGYSVAYYIFPLALLLCVLSSSFAIRMSRMGRWGFLAPIFLMGVAVFDGAFLPGAVKHALVLTGPDTRLLTRQYLHAHAASGESILLTHTIVGMNVWGPPLLPVDPPGGSGAFAVASREALSLSRGPHYRLRMVEGVPRFTPDLTRGCDWLVTALVGTQTPLEPIVQGYLKWSTPPSGFKLATVIHEVPPQSSIWPFLTLVDYEEIRNIPLQFLWRARARGPALVIYRRKRNGRVTQQRSPSRGPKGHESLYRN